MKLSKHILFLFLVFLSVQPKALDFVDTPLFLVDASIPNIVLMLDDSGSMDWEVLSRKHYDACRYQPRGSLKLETSSGPLDAAAIDAQGVTGDVACFYLESNFGVKARCYDYSETVSVQIFNDFYSSVRLRPGYGLRVYQHVERGGSYADIVSDAAEMPTGFDNEISSFEVYRTDDDIENQCGNLRTNGLIYPTGTPWGYLYIYPAGNYYSNSSISENYDLTSSRYFTEQFGDWRILSSAFNVTFYDPASTYLPWSPNLPNASFTAARGHGVTGGAGYDTTIDLTGSYYIVANDDKGYADSEAGPHRGADSMTTDSNGTIDIWDSHTIYQINESSVSRTEVSYEIVDDTLGENIIRRETQLSDITDFSTVNQIKQNFANWYQYSRRRTFVVTGAVSQLINSSPNYRYSYGLINNTSMLVEAPASTSAIPVHNENLLNDLYVNNRGRFGTPLRKGLNTVGNYLQAAGTSAPVTEECQQNFSLLFTDGYWGGTFSNSNIGNEDGDPYSNTVSDVAYYYYANDLRPDLDNNVPVSDLDQADHQHLVTFPVAFGVEGSLSDADSDGWPDVNGIPLGISDDWGDPYDTGLKGSENKINDLWHAAFNSKGLFSSARTPEEVVSGLTNALAEVDRRIGSATSIATSSGSLRNSSRAFQATFNSANWTGNLVALPFAADGSIINTPIWQASNLLDVRSANNRVIITSDIDSENNLAGVPFRFSNGSPLSSDYLTKLSSGMSQVGILGDVEDYAASLIDYLRGDAANESGVVQTEWVSCAAENAECTVPGTTTVRFGTVENFNSKVVTGSVNCSIGEFGDPADGEVKSCSYAVTRQYGFRSRASKLGDLIHSNPVYIGVPSASYQDVGYSSFKNTWASRAPMVYVGGNDGMLHGFSAATGEEALAFVPNNLADKVYELADSGYKHKFFVDGQINVGDVCTGSPTCSWRTMLAGGLRTGGRAVYALDVTDPAAFSESNANNLFMWEFSSDDDSDMGYFFGLPLIVKLSTGKWGVIISNGYNSDNGKAVLYILDAETGQPLSVGGKLDTQAGTAGDPNGLSSPTAIDTDSDGDVDLVYAGDLKGNLWKFDISSTNPSDWGVGYSSGGTPVPLFAGGSTRPITVAPAVGRHPEESGYMIYLGTGKYIESIDNANQGQPTQSFFGIWDDARDDNSFNTAIDSSELLQQTIIQEAELYPQDTNGDGQRNSGDTAFTFRLTSSNRICWRNCGDGVDPHRGWRFDMVFQGDNRGEKQVTNSVLRNGRIIFTTLQPSLSACDKGGRSWLMELNSSDGSFLSEPPFDLNQDGDFDAGDVDYGSWGMVDTSAYCPSGNCQAPSGIMIDEIVQTPSIMDCTQGGECKYVSGSEGGIDKIDENAGARSLGRQSWRELRGE